MVCWLEDEKDFGKAMGRLEGSRLWRQATDEQQDKTENIVYDLLTSESKSTRKTVDKLEAARLDEGTYALYKLAVQMYDEPTRTGTSGQSPTPNGRRQSGPFVG